LPGEDPLNEIGFSAYSWVVTLEKLLQACGDDLTPENVVAKATSMKSIAAPALLDGVSYSTKPTDYSPIKKLMIQTFDGAKWNIVRAVEVH
ncbi:MAG: branched-chain amino acid ABC transporter substrate-binding protein, partial [Rhodoblastus sp.]|nr:branched-chain amino acid ABC transporter substrate-binding protein [Rhodoblastus sp.]